MTELATRNHTLYRFFNVERDLLYVGITADPTRRFDKHSREKDWWTEVEIIEMQHFPDRQSVLAAEREAIRDEKPLHNVRMNAGMEKVHADPTQVDGLVGRFFHTWEERTDDTSEHATVVDGRVLTWQGRVVEQIDSTTYLIECFSWWDGELMGGSKITTLDEMARSYTFYENGLEMQIALHCRESGKQWLGRDGDCGHECTHVVDCIGVGVKCHRCAGSYGTRAEIVWKSDGRPDEQATLAALRLAAK